MSLIKANNLTKHYGQGDALTKALNGVSLEIKSGEFVAIMGPSGSGKSTLLHILGFLDRQSDGEYLFENKSFLDYSEDEIAHIRSKKLGFVFQMFNLLPKISVFENVRLPLIYSKTSQSSWEKKVNKAIEMVGLSHRIDHEPSQLSGGEKQRVAIARALVNSPQVIFADEPTGNLDSKSGKQIMEILAKLNKEMGHTIILITHETNTASYAERVIRLKDGELESDEKVKNRFNGGNGNLK